MMYQRNTARLASIALAVLLAAGPAWPWGREGHRVVALVAAKNLSPEARAKAAAILGTDDAGLEAAMAAAATWPDEINKPATGTANWHFIDVSVTAPFAVGTLCAGHDCVIDQILDMEDRLQNNRTGFTLKKAPTSEQPDWFHAEESTDPCAPDDIAGIGVSDPFCRGYSPAPTLSDRRRPRRELRQPHQSA